MAEDDIDLFTDTTVDEIFALTFHQEGPMALRALLDHAIETKTIFREGLEDAAVRLDGALPFAAAVIREAAERAEPEAIAKIREIVADPYLGNQRAKLAQMYRWGRATREDMIACGVDENTLAFATSGPIFPKKGPYAHE